MASTDSVSEAPSAKQTGGLSPAALEWQAGVETDPDKTGPEIIAAFVKKLPNTPGVYRMLDEEGDVLYVGKARKLKARVTNYTRGTGQSNRIGRMIALTRSMEFVSTRTETEALLLEANLIKRLRPRFNVLLRDDKSFPYILITGDTEVPQLFKHRGTRSRKGSYFGPFASASAVTRAINALQKAFLLGACQPHVLPKGGRPCLNYQIKRCPGTCTGDIDLDAYYALVADAKAFLSGRSKAVKTKIAEEMEEAAEALDFERAAVLRDRLSALSQIQAHQGINPRGVEEADVFALKQEGGQTCVQVFFFRTGQNWGNRAYFPKADRTVEPEEVLQSFVSQFYDDKPVPRLILTSHTLPDGELLEEAFSERSERKVEVRHPQRGEKKDLVDHALANAGEALGRKLAESASQVKLLEGVGETFGLDTPPRRVEVYDNSHIMGTNAVGGMIVAGPDGFAKNQYRKFNIKDETLTPGDDFAMMREVLTRRFSRLKKEKARDAEAGDGKVEGLPAWPDLVIIDGGKGQLSAAREVMAELDLQDVPLVAISKGPDRDAGRETFHKDGRDAFMLPPRDPVLYFLQRMRDEAHRFAIGAHRAKRSGDIRKNPLDEIGGIGPTRKRALLNAFGSAKGVSRAALGDLEKVPGVSAQLAKTIYEHFREG